MRLPLAVLLISLAARLLVSSPAEACTCSMPHPPCAVMFLQKAVFVGEATATRGEPINQTTTFAVKEVLAGTVGATVEVGSGGPCGMHFVIGKTYVVYAGGDGPTLYTGACSRTAPYRPDSEDVVFARNLPKRERAVIEGGVRIDGEGDRGAANVTITAGAHSTKTDSKGHFRLEVPPGNYTLTTEGAGLRVLHGRSPSLSLPVPAACATPTVTVTWDGRISGRVHDDKNAPLAQVNVHAVAAPGTKQPWTLIGTSDADGRFTIHEVPAGRFFVVVSPPDAGTPSPRDPYPTTYAPGTARREKARLVEVKRASEVTGVDLVLPAPTPSWPVSGQVVDGSGRPVAKAWVNVMVDAQRRSTGLQADDSGRFFLQELAGVSATLRACDTTLKNCTEATRTITAPTTLTLTLTLPH